MYYGRGVSLMPPVRISILPPAPEKKIEKEKKKKACEEDGKVQLLSAERTNGHDKLLRSALPSMPWQQQQQRRRY